MPVLMGTSRQATCTHFGATFWPKNCSAQLVCEQMPAQLASDSVPPAPTVTCLLLTRTGGMRQPSKRTVPIAGIQLKTEGFGPWPQDPWRPLPLTPARLHETQTCAQVPVVHVYSRGTREIRVCRHKHPSVGTLLLRHAHTGTRACAKIHASKHTYSQHTCRCVTRCGGTAHADGRGH